MEERRERSKCNIMSRLRNIFLSSSPNNFITPPTPLCSWNSSITLFQSGRRPLQAGKVTQYKLIQETTLQFCEDSASTLILKILVLCTNVQSPPAFEGGTTEGLLWTNLQPADFSHVNPYYSILKNKNISFCDCTPYKFCHMQSYAFGRIFFAHMASLMTW